MTEKDETKHPGETQHGWTPRTLEDRLLQLCLADHSGTLFLEVEVGGADSARGPRRLDGVLVPGEQVRINPRYSYSREDLQRAVQGADVHVLEAKRTLNRNVIGQVEVGVALFARDFAPASATGVAVCGSGNADLAWYCEQRGLTWVVYEDNERPARGGARAGGRVDARRPPDAERRAKFMQGWDDAVAGQLYDSIRTRKTHANMGNLFGWIYGEQPEDFREETWKRYVASLPPR